MSSILGSWHSLRSCFIVNRIAVVDHPQLSRELSSSAHVA